MPISRYPLLPDPADVGPVDLLAYAFLFKSMEFATPFFNLDECDFIASEGYVTSIKTFGYHPARNDGDQDLLQQITIHHYGSRDEFVIELRTKMAQDHLIFARIPPAATLEDKRISSHKIRDWVRYDQLRLTVALKQNAPDEYGVKGDGVGDRLNALASAIYWSGLGRWGVRAKRLHGRYVPI